MNIPQIKIFTTSLVSRGRNDTTTTEMPDGSKIIRQFSRIEIHEQSVNQWMRENANEVQIHSIQTFERTSDNEIVTVVSYQIDV